jgi:hypothetical protein
MNKEQSLIAVKLLHTIAWAFFAGCIVALPIASALGEHRVAAWLAAIVFFEVMVLVVNSWRCPITDIASRYTEERHDNFDIYLPLWLAKYNKHIFGALYVAGLVFALVCWLRSGG